MKLNIALKYCSHKAASSLSAIILPPNFIIEIFTNIYTNF